MPIKTLHSRQEIFTICVDTYRDGVPTGSLYHRRLPKGKPFLSLTQLLLSMDQVMDGYPSSPPLRTFAIPPQSAAPPSGKQLTGAQATFLVQILFQQNFGWQGSVTWLEGKREESFRSVLELVLLMDSALQRPEPSTFNVRTRFSV